MAKSAVIDVDQHLRARRAGPNLPSGVAGVGEDDLHGAFAPGSFACGSAAAALRVVGAWGGDAVTSETFGDGEDATTGEVLAEDTLDDRRGQRIWLQPVRTPADGGFAGIGMRSCVGQPVSIRRAAAKETSFVVRLRGHCRADPGFDPVPFLFRHPAVEGHDKVVRVGAGVNAPANLGHPPQRARLSA
jgi:hypothetical protein